MNIQNVPSGEPNDKEEETATVEAAEPPAAEETVAEPVEDSAAAVDAAPVEETAPPAESEQVEVPVCFRR